MNAELLPKRGTLMRESTVVTEFGRGDPVAVFTQVPIDVDTIEAGRRAATSAPGTMQGRFDAVLFVADSRLGQLPNRNFDEDNWFVVDGQEWGISQIHEAINKLSGECDHFEIYAYKGLNR